MDQALSSVRVSELIAALSAALDMTEGQPRGHAARTCLIGMRIGAELGLSEADRSALYYALLLKDAGCSSSSARMSELFDADDIELKSAGKLIDWAKSGDVTRYLARFSGPDGNAIARARRFASVASQLKDAGREIVATRCERGAEVVRKLDLPEAAAVCVLELDERYDGKGNPRALKGDEISLLGRIAALAQVAEAFRANGGDEAAYDVVKARRGSAFDPLVCDVFLALSRTDVLWTVLRADDLASIVAELEPDDRIELLDESRLDRVAHAFAKIIDAKSPYTSQHSVGVAAYAVAIGSELGWAKDDLRRLRRAGLVHDIGKLGISSRILDKPGALSDDEFTKMQTHAALSYDILARVPALRSLAASAASHHERLDGSGYPRGLNGHDICLASRVLAVADIYEALTAERPYRAAMPGDQALKIVREQAPVKLWDEAVAALERSLQASVPTSLAA